MTDPLMVRCTCGGTLLRAGTGVDGEPVYSHMQGWCLTPAPLDLTSETDGTMELLRRAEHRYVMDAGFHRRVDEAVMLLHTERRLTDQERTLATSTAAFVLQWEDEHRWAEERTGG